MFIEIYFDERGLLHKDEGPAMILQDGSKFWYCHGKKHRIDGPAIEYYNGDGSWYYQGQRHRLDGPAIDWVGIKEWYIKDCLIPCTSQKEFEQLIKLRAFW